MVYANWLFDVPRLMDLCALYGRTNAGVVSEVCRNVLGAQPKYADDLTEAMGAVTLTCQQVADTCGVPLLPDGTALGSAAAAPPELPASTVLDIQA